MTYINVGVYASADMERVRTKTALKKMIKEDPASVTFDRTSAFERGFINASEIPQGDTLVVVGPDPYTARNWYANVVKTATGTIKVS